MLKFSAGKYKNIQGEFSKVPLDSNKIGPIVKTKKPAISNDVVNDPRIRHPEWAKEEKLNPLPDILLFSKVNPQAFLGCLVKKSSVQQILRL
jgi:hypothetical protein